MPSQAENIDRLVKAIVELAHPLQIILFGSAARGDMTADSDIDLLVVMPDGTHRRNTARKLYSKIKGIPVPYDLVVVTNNDLEEYKNDVGYIYYYALKEGKAIYAGN